MVKSVSKFYSSLIGNRHAKVTFTRFTGYDNYNNIREKYTALVVLNQAQPFFSFKNEENKIILVVCCGKEVK